jgi:hypothetical protein
MAQPNPDSPPPRRGWEAVGAGARRAGPPESGVVWWSSLVKRRAGGLSAALLVLAAAGLALNAVLAPPARPAPSLPASRLLPRSPAGTLLASFERTATWSGGYVAQYLISNGGAPVDGWVLSFALPAGERIVDEWNGSLLGAPPAYVVKSLSWDARLATGAKVAVGFQVSYSGKPGEPSACRVNAGPCGPSGAGGATGGVAVAGGRAGASGGTSGPAALTAAFSTTSVWAGGYVANYTVVDQGPPLDGWRLSFTLPAGDEVTSFWNATLTRDGSRYTMSNAAWDGDLTTGASALVGFQVSGTGPFAPPSGCTIDGQLCTAATPGGPSSFPVIPVTPTTLPPASAPPPGGRAGIPFEFAPYVDATVDTPPFDLVADERGSGTRHFILGFVVAGGGRCDASWGGYYAVASGYYRPAIAALRRAGGDVVVSFGGARGPDLADACPTVGSLEAQYRAVVGEYAVSALDFDIEGADLGDEASIARRFEAVTLLEKEYPRLTVSVTVPVLPGGLDAAGAHLLETAISSGTRIDLVNVMVMDYGDAVAPAPAGRMGTYAIEAARATFAQLQQLYPGLAPDRVWAMLGVTPMIGVNDVPDEVFSLSDAAELARFAAGVGLGRVSMWAATRDVECGGGLTEAGSDTCSGVRQAPLAFSGLMAASARPN